MRKVPGENPGKARKHMLGHTMVSMRTVYDPFGAVIRYEYQSVNGDWLLLPSTVNPDDPGELRHGQD